MLTMALRKLKKGITLVVSGREEVAPDSTKNSPAAPEKQHQKKKDKTKVSDKLSDFLKPKKKSKCAALTPEMLSEDLVFDGNLEQYRLAEAQKQLVAAEELLFGSNEAARTEEQEDKLQTDYEIFILHMKMVIYESFNDDKQEILKNALTAILQEEAQDRRWRNVDLEEHPPWRPTRCREIHDSVLQTVVEERMKNADEQENGADKLSSSSKREVCRMGKQVQKDLLRVVEKMREFYPPDFGICTTYAQLYHQAFSTRLQELSRSSIDFEDCHYILSWIFNYYPRDVLMHKELKKHIDNSSLGPLLPEEDLKTLQEQYFSHKENEVRKWLSNAFEKEVKRLSDGIEPELMDGYYFSSFAVDVIPLIDSTVKEIKTKGCENKSGHILCQLDNFLISYMKSLEDHIKTKQESVPKILSADLVNIHQFRDYIEREKHLFPEETRTAHMATLTNIKEVCHKYFLSRIYTEMKPLYCKLWTQAWIAGNQEVMEELVKALENHIDHLKQLKPVCREDLMGELHLHVMTEYVKQMMKRKLKLNNKEQQQGTADFMCQDNRRICSLFAKAGSKEKWLSEILPKLSEILRLQDPGSLQLEIISLTKVYPDLGEQHVLAILNLKTNLSSGDLRRIKGSLSENRKMLDAESSMSFFSRVTVKKKIL